MNFEALEYCWDEIVACGGDHVTEAIVSARFRADTLPQNLHF